MQFYRNEHSEGPRFKADWSESAFVRVAFRQDTSCLFDFMECMRGMLVCRIGPPAFRSESHNEARLLNRNASNFADWYRYAFQERPDLVPKFARKPQEGIEGVNAVRLEKIGMDTCAIPVTFGEGDERYELRLGELSDRQRAFIALHASIHLTES